MKKLLLFAILIPYIAFSQDEKVDIVGQSSRIELQQDNYFGPIFQSEYINYSPDDEVLSKLKALVYSYHITIVLGTWCGDSQEQVARFIKVLDKLDYNTRKVTIIGVDRNKKAETTDVDKMDIQKVPTFIILDKNRNEVGRIIETPKTTLEQDLLSIIDSKLAIL